MSLLQTTNENIIYKFKHREKNSFVVRENRNGLFSVFRSKLLKMKKNISYISLNTNQMMVKLLKYSMTSKFLKLVHCVLEKLSLTKS